MLLKGKLGPILRPFDAIVEAVLLGRGRDSLGRCCGSRICGQFASIFASKRRQFSPRSGHDRGLIVILGPRRSLSDSVEAIPRRKLPNRSSIAPRSRFNRTTIAVQLDRDRGVLPRIVWTVRWSFRRLDCPIAIERYLLLMKIQRSSCRHVASGKRSDHGHLK